MTKAERQTGRTTRMLKLAVVRKEIAPVRIIVLTKAMIPLCLDMAPELRPNDFVVISRDLDHRLRAVRSQSQVFIDHAVWEHASMKDLKRLRTVLRLLDVRP
jgi:hypothetical protein